MDKQKLIRLYQKVVIDHFIKNYQCHPHIADKIAEETIVKLLRWCQFIKTDQEVQWFINIYSHLKYESFVYAKVDVLDFKPIEFTDLELPIGIP